MKLYVCWGTFRSPRPGGHPCRNAHEALKDAGWDPEVEKAYGLGILGDALNPTRRKVRELSGQNMVPDPRDRRRRGHLGVRQDREVGAGQPRHRRGPRLTGAARLVDVPMYRL